MILILRFAAIILRVFLPSSPVLKKFSRMLSFDSLAYSVQNLKENTFMNKITTSEPEAGKQGISAKMINSDTYFSVSYVNLKRNQLNQLYFFSRHLPKIFYTLCMTMN